MATKTKKVKIKKSKLEQQYNDYFKYCAPEDSLNTIETIQSVPQQVKTWVTYGAFEKPIGLINNA